MSNGTAVVKPTRKLFSRFPDEQQTLLTSVALTPGGLYQNNTIWPLDGSGLRNLRLTFHVAVTIGTGTTPDVLGQYKIIKNILLKTSRGEILVSCPALSLFMLSWYRSGIEPTNTPMAASSATYEAVVDIPFTFPWLGRNEDLALELNPQKYTHLDLQIQVGTVADLFATVGTSSVVITMDITLTKNKGPLAQYSDGTPSNKGKPIGLPYLVHYPVILPASLPYWNIESANDLAIMGFIMSCYSTFTAGQAYGGVTAVAADNMDLIDWKDSLTMVLNKVSMYHFREERLKLARAISSSASAIKVAQTGHYPHIFCKDHSVRNAYFTGGNRNTQLYINNIIAGTNQCDLFLIGYRRLR